MAIRSMPIMIREVMGVPSSVVHDAFILVNRPLRFL